MIPKIKKQHKSVSAFTLIEMVIVLVIMGILLMTTIFLSGDQIQKVKNKAVKESILAEMQSRYSRNLWSSSFAGKMYSSLEVSLNTGDNQILFDYKDSTWSIIIDNKFTDRFEIRYIVLNYSGQAEPLPETWNIVLRYTPYKISCEIWDNDENSNAVIVTRVNDNQDYCFEINQKNCRLIEVSESRCRTLECFLDPSNCSSA